MPRSHNNHKRSESHSFSVNNPDLFEIEGLTDEERWALLQLLNMELGGEE